MSVTDYSGMNVYCACAIIQSLTIEIATEMSKMYIVRKRCTTEALFVAVLFVVLLTWFLNGSLLSILTVAMATVRMLDF